LGELLTIIEGLKIQKKAFEHGKTIVLFFGVTWLSVRGVDFIRIDSLHIPSYWKGIIYHAICAVLWIGLIRFFAPHALPRLKARVPLPRLVGALCVIGFFVSPNFRNATWTGNSMLFILSALAFSLFIGLNEDLLSRGFFYGILEKYGMWTAVIVSSVQFGLLHLTNFYFGGQSLDYTAGQMVNAAAFGFLCCALMIFTGSIWVPIIFHGLSDFPLMMQSEVAFKAQVTGGADWLGTLVEAGLMIVVALVLISSRGLWFAAQTQKLLRSMDLID
jgi:membrane protease YdiL (CAAX protease family)